MVSICSEIVAEQGRCPCLLAIAVVAFPITGTTRAQNDTDAQATAIAALREDVAVLQTQVAEIGQPNGQGDEDSTGVDETQQSPTPDPNSAPETLLYQATWSEGMEGWSGGSDWKTVGGMLVNDGTNDDESLWIKAPFQPGSITDYALEAEIQLVSQDQSSGFGFVSRAGRQGAYWAGYGNFWSGISGDHPSLFIRAGSDSGVDQTGSLFSSIDEELMVIQDFEPGDDWLHYRLEVRGNEITLMVEGTEVLRDVDNRYLEGGEVGLWSTLTQINVRNFKVIAL